MPAATAPAPDRLAPRLAPAWAGAARLLAAACAGALATALWLTARVPQPRDGTAIPAPAASASATSASAASASTSRAPAAAASAATQPVLNSMREAAMLGQPYAAVDLLAALLAHYEARSDAATLFEAMVLLDREWNRPEMLASGMIQRVVQKQCPAEPMLRHFWVCDAGE